MTMVLTLCSWLCAVDVVQLTLCSWLCAVDFVQLLVACQSPSLLCVCCLCCSRFSVCLQPFLCFCLLCCCRASLFLRLAFQTGFSFRLLCSLFGLVFCFACCFSLSLVAFLLFVFWLFAGLMLCFSWLFYFLFCCCLPCSPFPFPLHYITYIIWGLGGHAEQPLQGGIKSLEAYRFLKL